MTKKKSKAKQFLLKVLKAIQGFDTVAKFIMFIVCVGTGILSVFYTGTYMAGIIENPFIAYLVSGTMYSYGLIGLNYSGTFKEQRKYILALIFLITSLCTILFSMSTSLMVNGEKYYNNKVEIEQSALSNDASNTFNFEILKQEMEDNKSQISIYQEDIKFQQTQNTPDYRSIYNEEGKWIGQEFAGTYSLTKLAQEAIVKDKEEIEKLNNRNKEIMKELQELSSTGVLENKEETVQTFTQMISKYLHLPANYIQLFMILFCSVFIDIISPLALMIAKNKEDGKVLVEEKNKLKIERLKRKEENKKEIQELKNALDAFESQLEEK